MAASTHAWHLDTTVSRVCVMGVGQLPQIKWVVELMDGAPVYVTAGFCFIGHEGNVRFEEKPGHLVSAFASGTWISVSRLDNQAN